MIVFRLIAFGRSSRGTRLGTSDWRAGRSNAPTAELRAASAYTGNTDVLPLKASKARPAATIAEPVCVRSISRRRSDASATTPLMMEKMTIGTNLTSPTMPSASPFRSGGTSSETCHRSAAFCIHVPVKESSRPIQIRRKFR
jgi:hypothetical protein